MRSVSNLARSASVSQGFDVACARPNPGTNETNTNANPNKIDFTCLLLPVASLTVDYLPTNTLFIAIGSSVNRKRLRKRRCHAGEIDRQDREHGCQEFLRHL